MNDNTIQKGMRVWLNTGSPAMTVKHKIIGGTWLCSWFVENDVKEHGFSAEQLTDQDPNPPAVFA